MLQYTLMMGTSRREWHDKGSAMHCYNGTKKPPIITAPNHVAIGVIPEPAARAQPKLINPGPAVHENCGRQQSPEVG